MYCGSWPLPTRKYSTEHTEPFARRLVFYHEEIAVTQRERIAVTPRDCPSPATRTTLMRTQRLLVILALAAVAIGAAPCDSWGTQLVIGQNYHSVQLLSATSAADLQE